MSEKLASSSFPTTPRASFTPLSAPTPSKSPSLRIHREMEKNIPTLPLLSTDDGTRVPPLDVPCMDLAGCSASKSVVGARKSSNFMKIISKHRQRFPSAGKEVRVKEPATRKRKASRSRDRGKTEKKEEKVKKQRIEEKQKSFDKQRKILEKKVERKYSTEGNKSKDARRSVSIKEPQQPKKPECNHKEKEKSFKEEYNRRLDCLARYGKNFYCPSMKQRTGLRPIYIDGSNVAFSHGQNECFSVQGLKICIDYFRKRGHEVKAFVPHFRLRRNESTNQALLHNLVSKKLVVTTPTLYIQNQRRSPYDDWYIVQSAAANGGLIVSSDNFQDIIKWNPNLRSVIEESRLVPTFVDDMLIFPVDPHGNRQNNLEQLLRF